MLNQFIVLSINYQKIVKMPILISHSLRWYLPVPFFIQQSVQNTNMFNFSIIYDKEMQQTLTVEKIETMNVWHSFPVDWLIQLWAQMQINTCNVFPLDSWICGFNSSFGIHFKSHRNASSVTALCYFFVFSLSGGCCLLQSLGPRTRRGKEKTYIAAGHNWEKNNVSNWRGQQDDRKCLQGIALLSDCHRNLVKLNC